MYFDNCGTARTTGRQDYRLVKTISIIVPLCLIFCMSISFTASAHTMSTSATVTKTLTGTVTGWSDNILFRGPASTSITMTLNIDSTTGSLTYSFTPIKVTSGSTTITITTVPGTPTTGTDDATTGALTLNGTLQLQGVPLFGTVKTQASTLSTENSLTAADGTQLTGQRVDANGNVTLVGGTSFTTLGTSHMQIRIVGVLQ